MKAKPVEISNERQPVVLIVDDAPAGQQALQALLEGQGYRLVMAANGLEALECACRENPDAILLDVMMPVMDGFEVCRRLRRDPQLAEVPVVMVTALDDRPSRLAGLEAGADDYIIKPFDRAELLARLRTIVRLNRYRSLQEERAKLQRLSHQMLEVQERERRALAVELHDEIGQGLTGLKMILQQFRRLAPEHDAGEKINKALDIADNLLQRIRSLSLNLRPAMLDDFGLYPALTWLAGEVRSQSGLSIHCSFNELDEGRFPPLVETAAFRIAQEALTNVVRHAQASQVLLSLETGDQTLVLRIRDDGKGFPAESGPKLFSTGISGMQERARMANGALHIESTPGAGACLTATFALDS